MNDILKLIEELDQEVDKLSGDKDTVRDLISTLYTKLELLKK